MVKKLVVYVRFPAIKTRSTLNRVILSLKITVALCRSTILDNLRKKEKWKKGKKREEGKKETRQMTLFFMYFLSSNCL